MSSDNDNVLVELRPFKHQVGGHTCVLELNRSTICKPHVEREAWFYRNAPEQFKEFTPKYRGEVEVTCDVRGGEMCLIARLPKAVADEQGLVTYNPFVAYQNDTSIRPTQKRKRGDMAESDGDESCDLQPQSPSSSPGTDSDTELWSIQCLKRQITKYGFWANNQPQKFIMLENLVHTYQKPCMLDLKMGTRQYGDDSSEEKRKLLEARCRQSTSGSLGFRICGTQVFQEKSHSYVTHDKYHGRQLNAIGVKQELSHFFHNGVNLRKDAVSAIIEKLLKLKDFLGTQSEFKLYSCSLLVMYDGCVGTNTCSLHSNIRNEEQSFPDINQNSPTVLKPQDYSHKTDGRDHLCDVNATSSCPACVHPQVDVRLIDFAHASSGDSGSESTDVNIPLTKNTDAVANDTRGHDPSDTNISTIHQQVPENQTYTSNDIAGANEGIIFGLDHLSAVLQTFL